MPDPLAGRILEELKSPKYRPVRARQLAQALDEAHDDRYPAFREALKELMREGRLVLGAEGTLVLPTQRTGTNGDELVGTFRQNRKGFGFVIPQDPTSHEDLYIGERDNTAGAITGDVVRAKIISRSHRDGKAMTSGRIIDVIERKNKRFVGSLEKDGDDWFVKPDGNTYTQPIFTPDAATKYIKVGTKVVCEITEFATREQAALGVITSILGDEGEKDVDLKTVSIQFNLPQEFPQEVLDAASSALEEFKATTHFENRYDMRDEIVCTIDPDDAKDYDDAISLKQLEDGNWELGVHIADVSHFVPTGSALDEEARERGNSTYFPGKVIPMLPEVLSNGICSLMEGVPRLCKSAFIVYDKDVRPIRSRFANTVIHSAKRLRYREAQDLIDGKEEIYHPGENKKLSDYSPEVIKICQDMNTLSKRIQKRRQAAGQLNLNLPRMELVLNADGKVVDAVPEDHSFTHTLIEMFMVEANESVARLLDTMNLPFLRRAHPDPDPRAGERLKTFLGALGHQISGEVDRKVLQALLAKVKDRPDGFAVNLAVLRSLSRAEYSPKPTGHFALASVHYCHFTSPIRRYADLTIHRLLDAYFDAIEADFTKGPTRAAPKKDLEGVPTFAEASAAAKHISYTERRSEDAERELRQVKILELMAGHVGESFPGVVTGVTSFGLFIQIQSYGVEGLNRYTELMDDWWTVDEKIGQIRGQRSGQKIRIGDVVKVTIARVDLPRRELDLRVTEVVTRGTGNAGKPHVAEPEAVESSEGGERTETASPVKKAAPRRRGASKAAAAAPDEDRPAAKGKPKVTTGATKRSQRSKTRDNKKPATIKARKPK